MSLVGPFGVRAVESDRPSRRDEYGMHVNAFELIEFPLSLRKFTMTLPGAFGCIRIHN